MKLSDFNNQITQLQHYQLNINGEQVSVGPQTSGDGGIGVAENQPVPPPSISEREREVNEEEAKQDENILRCKICNMPSPPMPPDTCGKSCSEHCILSGHCICTDSSSEEDVLDRNLENIRAAVWGKCIHCRQELTPEARLRLQVYMMQLQNFAYPSLGDAFVFNQ
uniref:ORF5L n=1 Tax=Planaria asexual strain-specific virus-like element type 2 TaxID=159253 RepID=Q91S69_9VIRU|nr:ORF5L [Planaria asexual strain-specific virus-like element type 2]